MRSLPTLLALLLGTAPALAGEISIPLPEGIDVETIETLYACGERDVPVTYINAGQVSLAVLELDGELVVAANVISASGARYAGGRHVWWSKGDEAALYDLMREAGEDEPVENCTAKG